MNHLSANINAVEWYLSNITHEYRITDIHIMPEFGCRVDYLEDDKKDFLYVANSGHIYNRYFSDLILETIKYLKNTDQSSQLFERIRDDFYTEKNDLERILSHPEHIYHVNCILQHIYGNWMETPQDQITDMFIQNNGSSIAFVLSNNTTICYKPDTQRTYLISGEEITNKIEPKFDLEEVPSMEEEELGG